VETQNAEGLTVLDAVVPKAPLPKDVVRQVVLTEGELLPWKGFWWKVHLNNDTHAVELLQGKPTASTEKLVRRASRWRKQHPKSKDGLRVGSASGLQVSLAGLLSIEPRS